MAKLPSDYIIGIIMFVFIIVGGVSLFGIMQADNANFATDERFTEFNETFNRLGDVTDTIEGYNSSVTNAKTDFGAFGVLNSLISSGWNTLRLLTGSLSFMNGAYHGLSTIFGLPWWIPTLIGSIVVVVIVFAIFGAIFQRRL